MRRGWRPSLALVLGGALAGTLVLSLLGLIALRHLGPILGFRAAAIMLAFLIGIFTLVPWLLMLRLLLRPVRALADYAGQVRARPGHLPGTPDHFGTRELHEMGRSVMDMAAALRAREASVRSFADHVTHEVKGPVAVIRAATELLGDGGLSATDRALVAQIDTAAGRIEAQLAALHRVTAAREADHRGTTTLADLTLETSLSVTLDGADVTLPMTSDGLTAVLDNLLANATAHGATSVLLRATPTTLIVADDGPGVSEGNRARIFQPFFTTRRETGGTGMGLAIITALLRATGGTIALEAGDRGATFRIDWPG